MSYRMLHTIRRLMCDKFSVLCTLAELNAKQEREETKLTNDKLTEMFEMQAGLDGRIIKERSINKDVSEWVSGITIAMESEIDEIRREVNWKWWKNPKEIDDIALQGEVIDMWHFLLSLSRIVGLTPETIHAIYMEKNAENHARQDGTSYKDGYAV
jgi:dimeric dUTPase (all-alpha-NTP-PPase superfamily)